MAAPSRPQITQDLDLQKPFVPRKQLLTALRLSNSNSNSNSNIAYFVNSHILHTFIIKWVDFIIVNTKIIFLHNILYIFVVVVVLGPYHMYVYRGRKQILNAVFITLVHLIMLKYSLLTFLV